MANVSVIVPVYNVEKFLNRCVDSLLNQSLNDIEIILVDDGSPDNCPSLCDEYSKRDSRIKVIHKKNAGLGMACNSGIEIATGKYVAFCDSDDFVDLDCYEYLYNEAIKYKCDAVYSGIKRIDQYGNISIMSQANIRSEFTIKDIYGFIANMIASPPKDPKERIHQMSAKIVLYSREVIERNNIRFHSEREYISEDLLFNMDFLRCCTSIVEIPRSFYYYFVNTSSLSQIFRRDRFDKYKKLRLYLLETYDFGQNNLDFRYRVDKMIIGYVRNAINRILRSNEKSSKKLELIKEICNDPLWVEINEEFPSQTLTLSKRIVHRLICKRHVYFLYLFYCIKLKIQSHSI